MEEKKTKVMNFVKYLNSYNLISGRLSNVLKCNCDGDYFVEDITTESLLRFRCAGKKTLAEFKSLKENYLPYYPDSPNCDSTAKIPMERFCCFLRSDILMTLKSIEDKSSFVETALLEKFERNGIELVNYFEL